MPQFTIQVPDGRKITVQADDQDQALSGVQDWYAKNQQPQTSPGPRAQTFDASQPDTPGAMGNNPMAPAMPGGTVPTPPASPDDYLRSFGANIDQLPIAGPTIYNAMRQARASVQGMTPDQVDAETAAARERAPGADVAGKAFYNIAPYAALAAYGPTARLLGISGADLPATASLGSKALDLAGRSALAFGSNEAIGTADSMARGDNLGQAAQDNLISSGLVASMPIAGATVRGIARGVPRILNWATGNLAPTIKAAMNTEAAGQKAVGRSMAADRSVGGGMSPADEAFARANGLDPINLDLGGPATRNLARSAKATSPEANAALASSVDRGAPGLDTANFLTKLVGGSADDLALRDGLQTQGRAFNTPAYNKAYADPNARAVWTPEIKDLMQSDQFRAAVNGAESRGTDKAAINGGRAVRNPFEFRPDGSVTLKVNKDGSRALPSLEFWNQVKINLDSAIGAAKPTATNAGDRALYADLTAMKQKLVGSLDQAVPSYKTARQGASAFFGAEDAMDAGRQFALQPRNLPEAKAAIAKMSPADRKAFEIGAASSAIDVLKTKDTFASVKQVFGSPAAREFWQTTLGPHRAAQLETYVKVQAIQDASKQAVVGGSQTHDLLVGSGLMAGGFAANQFGVDPRVSTTAALIGAARFAHGSLGRIVDRKVLTSTAELLASGDKAALNKVIANSTMSPRWRAALDAIFNGLHATARGSVISAASPAPAAAIPYPQTDTRDYSHGVPPAISQGPRVSGAVGN